jgi:hypothetical protein
VQEAVLTKAYAVDADFTGADMTNAVIDRVDFTGAKLRSVKFVNAVITGAEFANADLTGADFEDALIGNEDAKRLCAHPALACMHNMHCAPVESAPSRVALLRCRRGCTGFPAARDPWVQQTMRWALYAAENAVPRSRALLPPS